MIHAPLPLSIAVLVLLSISILYTAFALTRLLTFRFPRIDENGAPPSISILKPLCGLEPDLEQNLTSFCKQDYPYYNVVFTARDPADPALGIAENVRVANPQTQIVVASGGGAPASNPKIENLEAAMPFARGDIIVISDSDMRADSQYLRGIAAQFEDPRVGAATALFTARSTGTLVTRLGTLLVNDQFIPSVLVATAFEPLTYCFGATAAVRREALARIGGLEALGPYLADDYMLGRAVSKLGYRVAFAGTVPQTLVSESTFAQLWAREVRWARTIRTVRPLGYAGSVVTYVLPFALLFLLLTPNLTAGIALFLLAAVLRAAVHVVAYRRLQVPGKTGIWLVPLREFLSVAVWAAGFFGGKASWRYQQLRVRSGGSLK